MIIKSFELNKIKTNKNNLYLLYGSNEGHKKQVIKDLFEKSYIGTILRLEENEVVSNYEEFVSNLLNESLFEEEKLIIISILKKILSFWFLEL